MWDRSLSARTIQTDKFIDGEWHTVYDIQGQCAMLSDSKTGLGRTHTLMLLNRCLLRGELPNSSASGLLAPQELKN